MKLDEINLSEINWDFNEAWNWPAPIRMVTVGLTCLSLLGAGVYYDTLPQLDALAVLEKKETELRTSFEIKSGQASNLGAYQKQLEQIKQMLQSIIKQMPMEEEVAGLLIDISQTGLSSGLEFKLFKPAPKIRQDFYSELPINIEVVGKYEELLLFISGLASLPRIVTIHDLTIAPIEKDKSKVVKQGDMMMSVLVKTYHEDNSPKPEPATSAKKPNINIKNDVKPK